MCEVLNTVSTHIEGRRSIFVQGFLSGGIFKFCTFLPQKVAFYSKWRSNQEWPFIGVNTVVVLSYCLTIEQFLIQVPDVLKGCIKNCSIVKLYDKVKIGNKKCGCCTITSEAKNYFLHIDRIFKRNFQNCSFFTDFNSSLQH